MALRRGLQDAEALDVGLLGVLAGEIDEGAFFSALRDGDLDAMAGALGEQGGKGFAVVEIDGDEDGARDVLLVDVELLEQGAERLGRRGSWASLPAISGPADRATRELERLPAAPADPPRRTRGGRRSFRRGRGRG